MKTGLCRLILLIATSYYNQAGAAWNWNCLKAFSGIIKFQKSPMHHMQEDVAIANQYIAGSATSDRDLAEAWMTREDIHHSAMPSGPLGASRVLDQDALDFMLQVPGWKQMTNSELRPLLAIFTLNGFMEHFAIADVKEMLNAKGSAIGVQDLGRWERLFPNRVLNPDFVTMVRSNS